MNTIFEPNFAVLPGETLAETLATLGMTQAALAERTGRPLWESPDAAFRKSPASKVNRPATAAWLRQGELEAQKIDCAPFGKARFTDALAHLRRFTTTHPREFVPALRERCAAAGVAVVIVPSLPGVRAYGATRWLQPTKALIQLSLRGKTDDHLWFTFFHEAGHVLKHGKRAVFVEDGDPKASDRDPREGEAGAFACDLLIPPKDYERFCETGDVSVAAMRRFASRMGIAPGIVAGRLQHDRKVPFSRGNQLKRRLDLAP